MGASFGIVGFWSLYFDVKDWQIRYGEWKKSLQPSQAALMSVSSASNALIEEEGNEEGEVKVNIVNMDDIDSGVKIINSKLNEDEQNQSER